MNKVMIMKHLVVPREQLGPTYQVISGRQLLPFVHRIELDVSLSARRYSH